MFQIRWREEALSSIEEIGVYIAESNPIAANRVVMRIFEAVKLAASFPEMFPSRGDYRVCSIVSPYLIYYRTLANDGEILIVDVIHAARNKKPGV